MSGGVPEEWGIVAVATATALLVQNDMSRMEDDQSTAREAFEKAICGSSISSISGRSTPSVLRSDSDESILSSPPDSDSSSSATPLTAPSKPKPRQRVPSGRISAIKKAPRHPYPSRNLKPLPLPLDTTIPIYAQPEKIPSKRTNRSKDRAPWKAKHHDDHQLATLLQYLEDSTNLSRRNAVRSRQRTGKRPWADTISHDVCDCCGTAGQLICCEKCPRAYHNYCIDPPLDLGALPSSWICAECRGEQSEPKKLRFEHSSLPTRLFGKLLQALEFKNPSAFELPDNLRNHFRQVGTDPDTGAFIDQSRIRSAKFPRDPLEIFDSRRSPILCYVCSSSTLRNRRMITCDYCRLAFHWDCLTPPLVHPPADDRKWCCPLHADPSTGLKLKYDIYEPYIAGRNIGNVHVMVQGTDAKAVAKELVDKAKREGAQEPRLNRIDEFLKEYDAESDVEIVTPLSLPHGNPTRTLEEEEQEAAGRTMPVKTTSADEYSSPMDADESPPPPVEPTGAGAQLSKLNADGTTLSISSTELTATRTRAWKPRRSKNEMRMTRGALKWVDEVTHGSLMEIGQFVELTEGQNSTIKAETPGTLVKQEGTAAPAAAASTPENVRQEGPKRPTLSDVMRAGLPLPEAPPELPNGSMKTFRPAGLVRSSIATTRRTRPIPIAPQPKREPGEEDRRVRRGATAMAMRVPPIRSAAELQKRETAPTTSYNAGPRPGATTAPPPPRPPSMVSLTITTEPSNGTPASTTPDEAVKTIRADKGRAQFLAWKSASVSGTGESVSPQSTTPNTTPPAQQALPRNPVMSPVSSQQATLPQSPLSADKPRTSTTPPASTSSLPPPTKIQPTHPVNAARRMERGPSKPDYIPIQRVSSSTSGTSPSILPIPDIPELPPVKISPPPVQSAEKPVPPPPRLPRNTKRLPLPPPLAPPPIPARPPILSATWPVPPLLPPAPKLRYSARKTPSRRKDEDDLLDQYKTYLVPESVVKSSFVGKCKAERLLKAARYIDRGERKLHQLAALAAGEPYVQAADGSWVIRQPSPQEMVSIEMEEPWFPVEVPLEMSAMRSTIGRLSKGKVEKKKSPSPTKKVLSLKEELADLAWKPTPVNTQPIKRTTVEAADDTSLMAGISQSRPGNSSSNSSNAGTGSDRNRRKTKRKAASHWTPRKYSRVKRAAASKRRDQVTPPLTLQGTADSTNSGIADSSIRPKTAIGTGGSPNDIDSGEVVSPAAPASAPAALDPEEILKIRQRKKNKPRPKRPRLADLARAGDLLVEAEAKARAEAGSATQFSEAENNARRRRVRSRISTRATGTDTPAAVIETEMQGTNIRVPENATIIKGEVVTFTTSGLEVLKTIGSTTPEEEPPILRETTVEPEPIDNKKAERLPALSLSPTLMKAIPEPTTTNRRNSLPSNATSSQSLQLPGDESSLTDTSNKPMTAIQKRLAQVAKMQLRARQLDLQRDDVRKVSPGGWTRKKYAK